MNLNDLSDLQKKNLNDFANFVKFKKTWAFLRLINSRSKVTALFTGNQFGKTAGVAYQYVMRILGIHPVIIKNVDYFECSNPECEDKPVYRVFEAPKICPCCNSVIQIHKRVSRVFRFCSETLPGQSGSVVVDGESAEVKNTQYPAFKKWLPDFLIKKDTTFRSPTMLIKDPFGYGDIIIEYVSYNQTIQSTAGTQRLSVWYDEEPDIEFRREQIPRLLAENGDEIFSVTPANYITWMYDDIFEKAQFIHRTKTICDFLNEKEDEHYESFEQTLSKKSITVIQAATDDNPTLSKEAIDALFDNIDDEDSLAIRRYGIFKQVSGKIFKNFAVKTHVINENHYFPKGLPHFWVHARGIDYHPQTPWAFGAIALSPFNEAFIYAELNRSPEKYQTEELAEMISNVCGDYEYRLSLIDPLAEAHSRVEGGKSVTVRDDLNNVFYTLEKAGLSSHGFFRTWDTKGQRGRDEIRKRLKNASTVGRPFNNKVIDENGQTFYLPTLWIFSRCEQSIKSLKQWRWQEYADSKSVQIKEAKNQPEQRWSHFNMVWEAIFKNPHFKPRAIERPKKTQRLKKRYFQRGR